MNVFSELCHQQALQARLICPPNPAVGAVIVAANGEILGMGHTQKRGESHAEIMALREAASRGHNVRGACMYVSLEPCSHQGRTGPCCDALITAGIQKVVASVADPNPLVAGKGFARLRAAGVEVVVGPGAEQSKELNIGFFSRMTRQMPWVRLKIAASLDGKTALNNGKSQWITSSAARADGHAWRARACVVLTGIGTVLADNPRLDVRLVETPRQPDLVVVDSQLRTPENAILFIAGRAHYIWTSCQNDANKGILEAAGACVMHSPDRRPEFAGKVDLKAMLAELAKREINEVHVEAGQKLNGSLLREGLIDEVLMYLGPKMIGIGRDMAQWGPLDDLAKAVDLDIRSVDRIGPDIRIMSRVLPRN